VKAGQYLGLMTVKIEARSLARLGDLLHHQWVDADAGVESLSRPCPDYAEHDPASHCRESVLLTEHGEERGLYVARIAGCAGACDDGFEFLVIA
jgi:hypothetical protein